MKARMSIFLDKDDAPAAFGEKGRYRRAGRATADDKNVASFFIASQCHSVSKP